MLELRHWLRHTVGADPLCALRLAIAGVEQEEHGREGQPPSKCACSGKPTCEEKARLYWAQRPRRAKVAS